LGLLCFIYLFVRQSQRYIMVRLAISLLEPVILFLPEVNLRVFRMGKFTHLQQVW